MRSHSCAEAKQRKWVSAGGKARPRSAAAAAKTPEHSGGGVGGLRMSRIHVDVHGHAAPSFTVEEAAGDYLLRR